MGVYNSNLVNSSTILTLSSPYIIPLSSLYKAKCSTKKITKTLLAVPILAYDAMGCKRTIISYFTNTKCALAARTPEKEVNLHSHFLVNMQLMQLVVSRKSSRGGVTRQIFLMCCFLHRL